MGWDVDSPSGQGREGCSSGFGLSSQYEGIRVRTLAELGWGYEDVGLLALRRWLTRAVRGVRAEFLRVSMSTCSTHYYHASAANLSGSYQFFHPQGSS